MKDDENIQHASEHVHHAAQTAAPHLPRFTRASALNANAVRHALLPARRMINNILLIERDGDVREALTGVLRMHRWRVTAVAEPNEAYARLRTGPMPDLILIDSPYADSVAEFLHRADDAGTPLAQVPLIAMVATGHTPTGPVLKVLKKPFAIGPLLELIRGLD